MNTYIYMAGRFQLFDDLIHKAFFWRLCLIGLDFVIAYRRSVNERELGASITHVGLARRGSIFDDSHEGLEAGAPKVTTVTKIGNALAMASTGSSSRRIVEEEDGAAEGAAAGAGRLASALAGAADGADGDVEGAAAADAR